MPFRRIRYDQIWLPKGPECHKKPKETKNPKRYEIYFFLFLGWGGLYDGALLP